MAKKLTTEYVREEIRKRGYKLIGEYVDSKTKITLEDEEVYLYSTTFNNFRKCGKLYIAHSTNPYSIPNIRKHASQFNYELISMEYKNNKEYLQFKCPKCKEIFDTTWDSFQRGKRCPYCCNPPRKIKLGINTIWDTDPWMIDLGISEEDAKTHSRCSGDKVTVTCPHCGNKKETILSRIYTTKSIGCLCGDGVSYNEKFIIELLNQLNIKYEREYKPDWSNNKRYDFYLNDYNTIIETHGIQHYEQSNRGRNLYKEQKNDEYKKQLALQNGIDKYIILDCRYSELSWIKDNILKSKLSEIFDLSNNNIDWLKCEEFAVNSNLIKQICYYWNNKKEWETTTDLVNKFNVSKKFVVTSLHKGNILNWCNYKPKEEMEKSAIKTGKANSKPVEMFKNEKSLGIFESSIEIERQSEELFKCKLLQGNISAVCTGRYKQYKGYTFKYITKQEYEERVL